MYPVPAPRFDIFITAFEKFVHQRRKEIEAVDLLMRPYEIVREAMENARLPNDNKLELITNGIRADIRVEPDNKPGPYWALAAAIGYGLHKANLHETGEPAIDRLGSFWHNKWRLVMMGNEYPPLVELRFDMPLKSGKHILVEKEKYLIHYEDYRYNIKWLEEEILDVETGEIQA